MDTYANEAWLQQNYYIFTAKQLVGFQAIIDLQFLTHPDINIHEARNKALDAILKCADF